MGTSHPLTRDSATLVTWVLSLLKSKWKDTSKSYCLLESDREPGPTEPLLTGSWGPERARQVTAACRESRQRQPVPVRPQGLLVKMTRRAATGQAGSLVAPRVTEPLPSCLGVHRLVASVTQNVPAWASGNPGGLVCCYPAPSPRRACLCLVSPLWSTRVWEERRPGLIGKHHVVSWKGEGRINVPQRLCVCPVLLVELLGGCLSPHSQSFAPTSPVCQ